MFIHAEHFGHFFVTFLLNFWIFSDVVQTKCDPRCRCVMALIEQKITEVQAFDDKIDSMNKKQNLPQT